VGQIWTPIPAKGGSLLHAVLHPGYLRILANSICMNQNQNLTLINRQMRRIGWDDFDLDYHTFELAIDCLEAAGFVDQKYKPSQWYEEIVFN
jgi:hypothetical protein